VQQALESHGIGTMIHYPLPPYRQKAYAELDLPKGSFPIAVNGCGPWAAQNLSAVVCNGEGALRQIQLGVSFWRYGGSG